MSGMKRNDYMDFLKGICIISVIIGHSIVGIPGLNVLFHIVYSFHMPLLMFVSAWIEEQGRDRNENHSVRTIRKRAEGLLVPYVVWCFIYNVNFGVPLSIDYKDFWSQFIGSAQSGLWFLATLFGLKCVHVLYWKIQDKFSKNNFIFNMVSIFLLEGGIIILAALTRAPYLINMVSYAIPYFFGVIYVSETAFQKFCSKEWVLLLSVVSYIAVFPIFDFQKTEPSTQVIRIFLSLCVIVVCCKGQAGWQKNNRLKEQLCYLGQHSLAIYLLHGYFVDYANFIQRADSGWLSGIFAVIFSVGVAYTCTFIEKIIGTSKYASKILFGKDKK